VIRRLEAADAGARLEELAALLRDGVLSGASIGLLLPLEQTEIRAYWQSVVAALRERQRLLRAAFDGEMLIGSVQLALELRANGATGPR
jgi:acetyltransferase